MKAFETLTILPDRIRFAIQKATGLDIEVTGVSAKLQPLRVVHANAKEPPIGGFNTTKICGSVVYSFEFMGDNLEVDLTSTNSSSQCDPNSDVSS